MAGTNTPESRERIITTAVALFASQGYASTGLRELAEKAGVNLAMVNYFFGSKKNLLLTILETFFSGYLSVVEEELLRPDPFEVKFRAFVQRAVQYIADNRDYMIVTLAELPHDDPDITQYKAEWGRKAMVIIEKEICFPVEKKTGKKLSPAAVGPLIITMMSSRFLFAPIMERVKPPGYGEQFFTEYADIIATIFLDGVNGLERR
ncbi:MAG: TetR/AcrR family transcriptional regulator [Desulforhopalus sp.]